MREKKILEAEHISVSFRMYDRGLSQYDLHIISDLSVEVHEGEIMVIVGASGSGKSDFGSGTHLRQLPHV